jgi:hypothetical protein
MNNSELDMAEIGIHPSSTRAFCEIMTAALACMHSRDSTPFFHQSILWIMTA